MIRGASIWASLFLYVNKKVRRGIRTSCLKAHFLGKINMMIGISSEDNTIKKIYDFYMNEKKR